MVGYLLVVVCVVLFVFFWNYIVDFNESTLSFLGPAVVLLLCALCANKSSRTLR